MPRGCRFRPTFCSAPATACPLRRNGNSPAGQVRSPADIMVDSIDLLDAYARYQANSKEHAWTCGSLFSNDLGLFDMLGNMYEWCQDSWNASKPAKKGIYND